MKKINYLFVMLAVIALFAVSCGKNGATGPAGVTGATGATGPAGPVGPAGTNGSIIYSGSGAPAAATGVDGDFYVDLTGGTLYGPKTDAGWGTGFSLIGPTGATGASGNTVLSGSGIPDAGLGNDGDFYLDVSSYLLYGPKTDSGWGTAVSLQGPPGSANVEYSGWNTATYIRDTTINKTKYSIATLAAPALTQNILDNGSIQVYLSVANAGVFPMPYTSYAQGEENTISYLPRLSQFIVTRFTADNSASLALSPIIQYRYVLIPGGQLVGVKPHVDLTNYEAVRRYYRIPK